MKEPNIRTYLQEITALKKDASWFVQNILDECKKSAEQGIDFTLCRLHNQYVEEAIEYLITVAKLTVEVVGEEGECTLLEVSWTI